MDKKSAPDYDNFIIEYRAICKKYGLRYVPTATLGAIPNHGAGLVIKPIMEIVQVKNEQ